MIIIKIILSMLFGFLIGMGMQIKFNEDTNKLNEDLLKAYDDLLKAKDDSIESYAEYIKYLEGDYTLEFQDALNQAWKENINLKKKLKAYE